VTRIRATRGSRSDIHGRLVSVRSSPSPIVLCIGRTARSASLRASGAACSLASDRSINCKEEETVRGGDLIIAYPVANGPAEPSTRRGKLSIVNRSTQRRRGRWWDGGGGGEGEEEEEEEDTSLARPAAQNASASLVASESVAVKGNGSPAEGDRPPPPIPPPPPPPYRCPCHGPG
jgi:hypothetical protein